MASASFHLSRRLAALGATIKVFTYFDEPVVQDRDFGIDVDRHSCPKWYTRVVRRATNAAFSLLDPGTSAYQLADILQRQWGAFALRTSLGQFSPDVLVVADHGLPSLLLGRLPGCKNVLVAHHNPSRFQQFPGLPPFSRRDIDLSMRLENFALRYIDAVISPSIFMTGVFRQSHQFSGAVTTIPNLVDTAFTDSVAPVDPRADMGLAPDSVVIVVPSGGNGFKGALLLPQLARLVDCLFDREFGIVVTGHANPAFRKSMQGLSAKVRLAFPGVLSGEEVLALMKSASLCLYPTLVDNYSMALLEAAASSVPTVTFDVGGNAEIVHHERTGYLVDVYNVDKMAELTVELMLRREVREQLGAQAQVALRANQGSDSAAQQWLEVLRA
ncbi:hypothetical protein MTBLM1_40161 [Rhodospirillaceae bacterium LM-1]|nr:hypothetical protein MTBLM1_40161 [Rhodospirillaceae bacterium LM-1]